MLFYTVFLGILQFLSNYSYLNGYWVSYSWCDTPLNTSLVYVLAIHLFTNIELLHVQVQCFLHFHQSNGIGYHSRIWRIRINLCWFLFPNEKCSSDLFLTFLFLTRFISIFGTASFNDCYFIAVLLLFYKNFIVIKSIYVNKGF